MTEVCLRITGGNCNVMVAESHGQVFDLTIICNGISSRAVFQQFSRALWLTLTCSEKYTSCWESYILSTFKVVFAFTE